MDPASTGDGVGLEFGTRSLFMGFLIKVPLYGVFDKVGIYDPRYYREVCLPRVRYMSPLYGFFDKVGIYAAR